MRVFLSSVITGFEEFRKASMDAVKALRHDVLRSEDFRASPGTPQQVCLDGVRRSDLVVILLGARYGEIQPSGLSATHEEFREAKDRKEIIAFVQRGVTPEPKQQTFVTEVQQWSGGHITGTFSSPADLRDQVTAAIRDFEVSRATGGVEDIELLKIATELIPDARGHGPALAIAAASGPRHQVLRPAQLEDDEFQKRMLGHALFSSSAVLEVEEGTKRQLRDDQLRLQQESSAVILTQAGDMCVVVPAVKSSERHALSSIVEEDIVAAIARALRFMSTVLNDIDPVRRLNRIVMVGALVGAGYVGWKTREAQRRDPNRSEISMRDSHSPKSLTPPGLPRGRLDTAVDEIAQDLMVLLRREFKR